MSPNSDANRNTVTSLRGQGYSALVIIWLLDGSELGAERVLVLIEHVLGLDSRLEDRNTRQLLGLLSNQFLLKSHHLL